ncbi:LLM class oxidoreductase [Cupriavidus sp. USMAHM13]|uniref:LLM class oxidoreductase n=1 Tax=Cupriavidus sp. USMAHM13 TaxID=1389192 RepID=UPI0008A6E37E|nr:LLM class oxidoreductase [Cupriavidus sp. USMAHM13]AOZ02460.1 LLM class oxidoreductase [Cupriavidus sp. USMAHM13]
MRTPSPSGQHRGFARMFQPDRLTLGLMLPLAPLENGIPDMRGQLDLAARADRLGFATLWVRDVPLFDPQFNDAGQIYDPWVWLGQLATVTRDIALSAAGIVLPLRHPLHTAKAAASVDVVSGGRFVLGAASGDRPAEYPAFHLSHEARGAAYRESVEVIRRSTAEDFPRLSGSFGTLDGLDLLPKASGRYLPMLAVGSAQQTLQWIARNLDGWVTYFRPIEAQKPRIDMWRSAVETQAHGAFRPFATSMFIDLADDPDAAPSPIFLGYRLGRHRLLEELDALARHGANHVAFNLRHSTRPAGEVLEELAEFVLPRYPSA